MLYDLNVWFSNADTTPQLLLRHSGPDWLYKFGFIGGSLLPKFLLSALKSNEETVLAAILFAPILVERLTNEESISTSCRYLQ